jgi:hypothetical protein
MEIAFLLYPGMTALDFVGPHEVLCRLPGVVIRRVSKQPGPVKTDSEVQLIAECGFGDADNLLDRLPARRGLEQRATLVRSPQLIIIIHLTCVRISSESFSSVIH